MAVLTFDFLACVEIRDLHFGEGNPLAAPALTEEGTGEMVEVVQVEKGIPFFQWVFKPPMPSEVDLIGDCTAEITSASVASCNSPQDVFIVG